jgi:hypothetical protein
MTKYASADDTKNLLQLQSATELHLVLETEECWAVTDEIRRGRYNVRFLHFVVLRGAESDATEAVKAVASAIHMDGNLEQLTLDMENDYTNEAGVALAEALMVNTTLRLINLSDTAYQCARNKKH